MLEQAKNKEMNLSKRYIHSSSNQYGGSGGNNNLILSMPPSHFNHIPGNIVQEYNGTFNGNNSPNNRDKRHVANHGNSYVGNYEFRKKNKPRFVDFGNLGLKTMNNRR